MTKKLTLMVVFAVMLIAGCGAVGNTGQTSNDANAVQQFFPTVSGYNTSSVNDIVQAITTVTGGISVATGNPLGAVAIAKLTSMIDCYRSVGAVDARIYTQVKVPPVLGAVAIVNQNRVADNFLSCATGGKAGAGAQGATADPQPCIGSGSFVRNDNTFLYIYAASDQSLCTSFDTHFAQYK
ncbi:MAG TPA: hypothetical protein VHL11_08815 [Phototrophicaceae bacterium]|nr:hypothetical protein [Phototrophicaceae bacterium]